MFRTLRARYVLSHMLPMLIIVPLVGLALDYGLESLVLMPNVSGDLVAQAGLMVEVIRDQPGLWSDPAQAQAFAARFSPRLDAHLMLLDARGRLLASTEPTDAGQLGQAVALPGLAEALAGTRQTHANFNNPDGAQVIDVLAPVADPDQRVVGIIRLSHRVPEVYAQFLRLRYLTAGAVAISVVLGSGLGLILGVNLERPLRQMSWAVTQLAGGQHLEPLAETGPAEVVRLAHAFNSLERRRRLLEDNRRQLLDNLVHELGRPLGALHSAIQALQVGAHADAALRDELLAGMDNQLRRLHRLVDDLAGLQDQITGRLELSRRPLAAGEWLPPMLALWREAATAKGLRWQVSLPATLPTVQADPDRLSQAVGNLLSNAIKYTPPGGSIVVEAGVTGTALWIRVGDSGPGIPPDKQARIFEPFYRAQPGRRFALGLGLGLSIARDLVNAHGGRLELDSVPGSGSRFTIWLPLET